MQLNRTILITTFLTLLFFCATETTFAEEWKLLFGLRGQWKFEIGDDLRRAKKEFNDSRWESIYAPSAWEDQGYPGYDGYAWYRKHFRSSGDWQGKTLAFRLGNIDDVDQVYLNGHLIGATGKFPPDYQTAYNVDRVYYFSPAFLSPDGDNVISVRVYDGELSGGILRGNLGVYEDLNALQVDVQFPPEWKFRTGDDPDWKDPQYDDNDWNSIIVPAYWETQGYADYDGFAWYRVRFHVPADLTDQKMILLLGKIDDFDETFINGQRVGHTGNMENRKQEIPGSDAYQQDRAYLIPPGVLKANEENVLAVRVYDGFQDGGIYAAPIGLITRSEYLKWQKHQNHQNDFLDWLFK